MVTKQAKKWGGGDRDQSHPSGLLSSSAFEGSIILRAAILKKYPLLLDESKIFNCCVHRGQLIRHHENLRCFALHFAASLCHIRLLNQEKPNNNTTKQHNYLCTGMPCLKLCTIFPVFFHVSLVISFSLFVIVTNGCKNVRKVTSVYFSKPLVNSVSENHSTHIFKIVC